MNPTAKTFAYIDAANLHKGVGDGDYAGLVTFFKKKNTLRVVISPSDKCSYLLRKQNIPLLYLGTQRGKLSAK